MGYATFQTKVAVRSILDKLEIALRTIIVETLEDKVGIDWWAKSVPRPIVNRCISWQKNHIGDPFRIGEIKKPQEYMSMGHLIAVINSNEPIFQSIFATETTVFLKQVVELRDVLSHPTDIEVDDIKSCKIAIRGMAEQVSKYLNVAELIEEFDLVFNLTNPIAVHNLPTALYNDFFGREKDTEFVEGELLYHPNTWVLLIDGIGGIGKSSLAFKIAQQVIEEIVEGVTDFQHVIWISAKSNRLTFNFKVEEQEPDFDSLEMMLDALIRFFSLPAPAEGSIADKRKLVNKALEMTKCLLIVDNLETVSDETIYSFFDRIPSHNKILLTSRDRRYKLLEGKGLPIEGLAEEAALLLIKSKIEKNHIDSLKGCSDQVLSRFTEKTHGHPLILECLLHQIYMGKPVEQALKEMDNAELLKVFDFCFGSTYSMLDEESQMILICLVLFDRSVGFKEISFVCDLGEQTVATSIEKLKRFSLIKEKAEEGTSQFYLLPVIKKYVSYQMSNRKVLVSRVMKRFDMYQKEISKIESLNENQTPFLNSFSFTNDFDKVAAAIANSALNDYQHSGNYEEAVEALNSALTLSPKSSYICQIRALIEKSAEFFGEAAKWYDRAISFDPQNALLWRLWGDLEKAFNYVKASEKYQEAVNLDSTDKRSWFSLGYCQSQIAKDYWERHDFNKHEEYRLFADQSLENAIYDEPESRAESIHNVKVFHQKGWNLFHLGEHQKAVDCCIQGLKYDKYNKHLLLLKEKAERRI